MTCGVGYLEEWMGSERSLRRVAADGAWNDFVCNMLIINSQHRYPSDLSSLFEHNQAPPLRYVRH